MFDGTFIIKVLTLLILDSNITCVMKHAIDLCPILSLRSTQVTIVRSTRETGDMHMLSMNLSICLSF